eukprot:m.158022 g.158022  ORF g.158022 m.158022 type:complete len:734 (+) comp10242_c1_seq1:2155-4356(+)
MATLRRKLALVAHLPMLQKATSDDEQPTPGYMYDDICKITFTSVSACSELEDYLIGRLKKKKPHILAKTLKILKVLVEKGHDGFRQDLQRRTDEIRQCQSFRGAPHPLHGDTFNQQVRDNAKALMEALFDPENTGPRLPPGAGPSVIKQDSAPVRSSHTASSVPHAGGYYNEGQVGASGKKMWGFGSTPVKPEEPSFLNKVKTAVSSIADRLPDTSSSGSSQSRTQQYSSAHAEAERSFRNAGTGGSSGPVNTSMSAGTTPALPAYQVPSVVPDVTRDDGYELRLVKEICAPGGVRVQPQAADLSQFIQRCATLDCHKVCEALAAELDAADADKQCMRIMYVIEALATSSIMGVQACLGTLKPAVEDLLEADQSKTRKKAERVMKLISAAAEQDDSDSDSEDEANAQPTQSANILDLGLDAPTAPAATPGGSLFSGMAMGGVSSAPTQQPPASQPAVAASLPASAPAQVAGGSLFAGMQMGPPTSAPAAAAAPAPVASPLDDLGFGGLSISQPTPAAVSSPAGGMSLMWEEPSAAASFDPLQGLSMGSAAPASSTYPGQDSATAAASAAAPLPFIGGPATSQSSSAAPVRSAGMPMAMPMTSMPMASMPMSMAPHMMAGAMPMGGMPHPYAQAGMQMSPGMQMAGMPYGMSVPSTTYSAPMMMNPGMPVMAQGSVAAHSFPTMPVSNASYTSALSNAPAASNAAASSGFGFMQNNGDAFGFVVKEVNNARQNK